MHQNEFQVTEELRPTLSVKLQCIKENVREDDTQMLKWWNPQRRKRKLVLMENETNEMKSTTTLMHVNLNGGKTPKCARWNEDKDKFA